MKKHIVCFGDSNTHGYCSDPADCADGGDRFNENERWPCLLQGKLGEGYLILEEGLSGRTTAFPDPMQESMSGLDSIFSCLMSHEPVDLLIVMLGTNDTKERFAADPACIGSGMETLLTKATSIEAWKDGKANILLICPPHIGEGIHKHPFGESMGADCTEKSRHLAPIYRDIAERLGCAFLDAEGVAEFNKLDCMHLTRKGHSQLAEKLAGMVKELI